MNNAALAHNSILSELRKKNLVDISTLPSDFEKENLQSQYRNIATQIISDFAVNDIEKAQMIDRISNELFGVGPLVELINDNDITEILVNGPDTIWYEKSGAMFKHGDSFLSDLSYKNFILRLTTECRIQANLERPFADGFWRSFRVHLIAAPLAQNGPVLSLRRHPDIPWSLAKLEEVGWATPANIAFVRNLIHQKKSFLVVGPTGTGKTSLLNACLQEILPNERVIAIEDTSELHLPNSVSIKLLSRIDPQRVLTDIDQMELIRQALRMRPDRIIMGEIRGAEAKDLLMALSTGHEGGMGTMHAESARQALFRLEMLVQLGAPQWSLQAIRHLIFFGIQYVICVERNNRTRQLASVHRLSSIEESGFCLEKLV